MKNKFSKIKSGMRFGLMLFYFLFALDVSSQKDTLRKKDRGDKWPYFGEGLPAHLNVSGGYQGFYSKAYFIGISCLPFSCTVNPANTATVGPRAYYKFFDNNKKYYSYEAELAIYTAFVFGLNVNYNVAPTYNFIGFKPFIGFGYYNITINYGYNFFNKKTDTDNFFRHNIFHITVDIPICKFSKKTS